MRGYFKTKICYWAIGLFLGSFAIIQLSQDCVSLTEVSTSVSQSSLSHVTTSETSHVISAKAASIQNKTERDNAFNLKEHRAKIALTATEWLNCAQVYQIFAEAKTKNDSLYRKENIEGNRGIYFTTIINQQGNSEKVVIKRVTVRDRESNDQLYRYHLAMREIGNLRKLQSLKWKGIPQLYGSCVQPDEIIYIVSEIIGKPFCSGTGMERECASLQNIVAFLYQSKDVGYKSLLWFTKVTCFFKQFEEHQVFMEDISGINFHYSPQTLDIFLVDLDSLLFYGDVRINSRYSCRENHDCSSPKGKFWKHKTLNLKIHGECVESDGYCLENRCWGFDASLNTCGITRWLLKPFVPVIPRHVIKNITSVLRCMRERHPEDRCSMTRSCEEITKIFRTIPVPE